MSKNSLSEDEFKKLVERLSQRRNELEGRITIDSVRESLVELGLSDLLRENDIEEVRGTWGHLILKLLSIKGLSPQLFFVLLRLSHLNIERKNKGFR